MAKSKIEEIPQEIEIERSLLSTILTHPAEESSNIIKELSPEDFYSDKNRIVFKKCVQLNKKGSPLEIPAVLSSLTAAEKKIVSGSFLSKMVDENTTVDPDFYIVKLKKVATRREAIRRAYAVEKEAKNPDCSMEKLETLSNSLARCTKETNEPDLSFFDQIEGTDAVTLMGMEFPEPQWIVEGIIPEGVLIFAGKPKMGKSVIALNMCVGVSMAGKVLGRDVVGGSVLYLHLEDNQRRIQKRLKAMLPFDEFTNTATRIQDNLHLFYKWPRVGEGGLTGLDLFLKEHKCRLVIIDTMKMFQAALTKKDAKKVQSEIDYDRLSPLREIAERYQTTIIPIMHARKQSSDDPIDLISGTLGISGAVDNILVMYKRKGNRSQLWVQGRDVDQEEYTIEYSPDIWTWQMLGESSNVMASDKQQIVLNCLIQNTEVTPGNLGDEVTLGVNEIASITTVNKNYLKVKILPKLLKLGVIAKSGRGQYYAIKDVCKNT